MLNFKSSTSAIARATTTSGKNQGPSGIARAIAATTSGKNQAPSAIAAIAATTSNTTRNTSGIITDGITSNSPSIQINKRNSSSSGSSSSGGSGGSGSGGGGGGEAKRLNKFRSDKIYNTHIELLRKIMKERNNTVEIFSKGEGTKAFNVDKDLLEKRVSDILSQIP